MHDSGRLPGGEAMLRVDAGSGSMHMRQQRVSRHRRTGKISDLPEPAAGRVANTRCRELLGALMP